MTHRLVSHVPVPPPDTTSPPTTRCASVRIAIDASTFAALPEPSIIRWPS